MVRTAKNKTEDVSPDTATTVFSEPTQHVGPGVKVSPILPLPDPFLAPI